MLIELGF